MKNDSFSVKHMVVAAMFLAMGLLLPYLTLNNPPLGQAILLMHLPVLLCGVLVGSRYALLIGLLLPITRSLLIGTPPMFPIAVAMTFELATYGFMIGLLYKKLPKNIPFLFASLIGAMLAGRVVWAGAMAIMAGVSDNVNFSFQMFTTAAFVNAIPGIILQLVLIPTIVAAFKSELSWKGTEA
ncbi:MAG: ECF transporter S component [Defluviitaleaceae bacterium]|nr:ECF transporter S component [Defluviitaleaceae bacterium]